MKGVRKQSGFQLSLTQRASLDHLGFTTTRNGNATTLCPRLHNHSLVCTNDIGMSQIQDIKGTATSSGPDDAALESEDEGWPLQTVAIAGAAVLVILPVLYRIGLGSSIIVIVLAV